MNTEIDRVTADLSDQILLLSQGCIDTRKVRELVAEAYQAGKKSMEAENNRLTEEVERAREDEREQVLKFVLSEAYQAERTLKDLINKSASYEKAKAMILEHSIYGSVLGRVLVATEEDAKRRQALQTDPPTDKRRSQDSCPTPPPGETNQQVIWEVIRAAVDLMADNEPANHAKVYRLEKAIQALPESLKEEIENV